VFLYDDEVYYYRTVSGYQIVDDDSVTVVMTLEYENTEIMVSTHELLLTVIIGRYWFRIL